jgi:hypothetical protein
MQGTSRSELAVELERCAHLFEETAAAYAERDGVRAELVTALLLAGAALEAAAHALDTDSPSAPTAQLIASTLVRDVIDAAERRGLDATLLHCVAECRRVIQLCG